MIAAKNNILTDKGYVRLACLSNEEKLPEGKVYELYFSQVTTDKLYRISFVDDEGRRVSIILDDSHEFIAPEGNFKPGQAIIGKRFFFYNKKKKRKEVRTICGMVKLKKKEPIYCVYPIITQDKYIVEGALLRNVGL